MKKNLFIASAVALLLQPSQTFAEQTNGEHELANMEALYKYAWSLDYPQLAEYDNVLQKMEYVTRITSALPSAVLGYQIKDYDRDDQMELLVIRSDTTQDDGQESNQGRLVFQIYEANSGNVVLASEIVAEEPAFATGIGNIRVYSRNIGNKILIGCDQYEEGFLWDGTITRTSYYDYNGTSLEWNNGMEIMGSVIESAYVQDEYSKIGLNENQVAQLGGGKTTYDCLPETELIAETWVDSDFDQYIPWSSTAAQGDTQVVGNVTIASYSWFPGSKPAIAQELKTESTEIQTGQSSIQQLSNWADYLYITSDFQTMQINQIYYLISKEGCIEYDCYQIDGTYVSTIPYGSAKSIIDTAMVNGSNLPGGGGRAMIVWDSPYGLCAYSRTYKDYSPWYSVDANGNYIENYPDVSQMPYEFNGVDIQRELDALGLPESVIIPESYKVE